jgi:Tol biopolymer transport system component
MTLNLDGSDQTVVDPPIETLNLFIGASSADGRVLAFNGMDETNPANTGLWIASPSLEDARQVTRLLDGWLTIEPFGVTPDGSKIVFFAETGPNGGATHGGDLYVINADGTGLRQLNPGGPTKPAYMGMPVISLSPDGSRAAFGVAEAVFIVELAGGEAHAITPRSGFVWAVSWSPADDWLTYTRLHGRTPVIALVRPDGSDNHEISPIDETDEANAAVWSQDGDFLLVRRDLDVTTDELNDLWIMGLDGTWIGQVTHQPSSYGTYWWAPAPGS